MPIEEVTRADLQALVDSLELSWRNGLIDGVSSPKDIAKRRRQWEIMSDDWINRCDAVLKLYGGKALSKWDKLAAWETATHDLAVKDVALEDVFPQRWINKMFEYKEFIKKQKAQANDFFTWYKNEYTGITVIVEPHRLTPLFMDVWGAAFDEWLDDQIVTERFLTQAPVVALGDFFAQRPDMKSLFQIIHALPKARHEIQEEVKVPFEVEAFEFGISMIWGIGHLAAVYEVVTGENLFGYKLTELERSIIAASIVLPVAGRVLKRGRLLYSEARLARLYGQTEQYWGKLLTQAIKTEEEKEAARLVEVAAKAIRRHEKLAIKVAKELAEAVPKLMHAPATAIVPVEKDVVVLFQELSKKYPALATLDEHAIRRILAKGIVSDHIQGQLLEELMLSHILPWLRTRAGGYALGVKVPVGCELVLIPGDIIMDVSKRGQRGLKLTDGMLGYYKDDIFHICAIFESKSGQHGSRELRFGIKRPSELTDANRKELRAMAKQVQENEMAEAERLKKPYTATIEEIEIDLLKQEPGQITRDFERLDEAEDGTLAEIWIGSEIKKVKLVRGTRTKVFAILPKGARLPNLEKQLASSGYNVEGIAAPIPRKEIKAIIADILPLAEKMLKEPPGK